MATHVASRAGYSDTSIVQEKEFALSRASSELINPIALVSRHI